MPQLSLSLLGSFDVRLDGVPVTGFRSDKARALLAYLVVEADRPHTRTKLAGLLWPDYPDSAALTYLRHALSNLRKILANGAKKPPFLRVENDAIQFLDHETCWSDFTHLTRALQAPTTPTDRQWQERLQQGLTSYRRPLLDGFALVDSDRFEEWLLLRRERLQREVIEAWTQLANSYLAQQAVAPAISALQRIVELEPTAEETHRHLMQLFAGSGKRREALAQFERCRQLLADELGVNPAAETLALYQQISQPVLPLNRMPTQSPPPFAPLPAFFATPQIQASKAPVLVARQVELAHLDHLLAQAYQGEGAIVFITGEAGQGKTALATEFALRVQARLPDLLVAGGNCNAQAGMGDPYLPFCEILELLTGAVESRLLAGALTRDHALRLWRAAPLALQALCEVAPDLIDSLLTAALLLQRADALAGQAPALRSQLALIRQQKAATNGAPQPRQEQLLRQVTTLLQRVAQQHPLLLLIDDLQWADNGSIQLLFHLARQLAGQRILLIGMLRASEVRAGRGTGDTHERHPLESVINELKRSFGEIEIDLGESTTRVFVDALVDSEPNRLPEEFRATLYKQTDSHPLFTVELLRGMQTRGDLLRDSDGCWIVGKELNWERLPARVEAVIAERIGRLTEPLQRLLQVASIEGEFFTAEVVASVLGVSEAEIIAHLSQLLDYRHQLVRARGIQRVGNRRLSFYRFSHVLFQRYLYQHCSIVECAWLHEATGNALEQLYQTDHQSLATVAVTLAYHFEAAALSEKAIRYYSQAGERALRLSANQEAIAHLQRALQLLAPLLVSNEQQQVELKIRLILAPALSAVYGWTAAQTFSNKQRAYQLAQEVGDETQLFVAMWGLASHYGPRSEYRAGIEISQKMLELAEKAQGIEGQVIAHRLLCGFAMHIGNCLQGWFYAQQVFAHYKAVQHHFYITRYSDDPGITVYAWSSRCLWFMGYPEQARLNLQQGIDLARQSTHTFTLAFMLTGLAVHQYRHDLFEVGHNLEELEELIRKHQFSFMAWQAKAYRGWWLSHHRETQAGIKTIHEALADVDAIGGRWARAYFLSLLADAHRCAGQIEQGLRCLDEAFNAEVKADDQHWDAELYRLKGEFLLAIHQDHATTAEANFQQALAIARQQQAKSLELRAATSLARLWQAQGKIDEAYQVLAPVYNWFTEGFATHDLQVAKALLDELNQE